MITLKQVLNTAIADFNNKYLLLLVDPMLCNRTTNHMALTD
jgi:hypothetical protein